MKKSTANAFGVASLFLWCMNVAVTRHVGEAHPFGMPGLSFAAAGLFLLLIDRIKGTPPPWRSDASPKFWFLAGSAFVLYLILYVGGLSYSDSRELVLPLGLINYFWPSLILLFMPLFFHCTIRPAVLAGGMILCIAGVGSALLWGMTLEDILAQCRQNWPAVAMMAGSALLWAFYSNAARKWGGTANGVGWFMLAGGICFLILWLTTGGSLGFTKDMLAPFLVHALLVNAAAYLFWDFGVRWGDIGLMGTLANFLPLGSIVFGIWYLNDKSHAGLWIGAALVTLGAILCRRGSAG